MELTTIYDVLLMRHIREPRGYRALEGESARTDIHNPFCGDELRLRNAAEVEFDCQCCGISMGVASLMTLMCAGATDEVKRQRAEAALAILRGEVLHCDLTVGVPTDLAEEAREGWQLLAEIARVLPSRRTCASLGWQALLGRLEGKTDVMATEIKG